MLEQASAELHFWPQHTSMLVPWDRTLRNARRAFTGSI